MRNEDLINDLFESARSEKPIRSFAQTQEFLKADLAGAKSNLVIKWLKQYKMNILITTSTIAITTTFFLYPEPEVFNKPVIQEIKETTPVMVDSSMAPNTTQIHQLNRVEEETAASDLEINPVEEISESSPVRTTQKVDTSKTGLLTVNVTSKSVIPKLNTKSDQPIKAEVFENEVTEHSIILESSGGKSSAAEFEEYLKTNLSTLNPEMSSSASTTYIKKFNLRLFNGYQADFRMQLHGFDKLELYWETDANNRLSNMWYRLNSGETKAMDFSKEVKSSIKVRHKNTEF